MKLVFYNFTPINYLSLVFLVQVRLQALQVMLVYYLGVVPTIYQVLFIEGILELAQKYFLKLVIDLVMDVDVVSADASLPAVDPFSKYNAL